MDLADVYDLPTLANLLGCSAQQLGYYIYARDIAGQYKKFEIRKKSGGVRIITAPATNLDNTKKHCGRAIQANPLQALRHRLC